MTKLEQLLKQDDRKIYILTKDEDSAKQFLQKAENNGFLFADGALPTQKHISDIYRCYKDKTLSYVGICGRIAVGAGKNIILIDSDDIAGE